MVTKTIFGALRDGRPVHGYRLSNRWGESVLVLDYGASVQEIWVRGADGTLEDVALGSAPERLESCTYEGGTIGRCANRIGWGRCVINGEPVQLEQNMRGHFLHGASGNYAKKLFEAQPLPEENGVRFHLHDTGEGGFHCCVEADFTFRFDDDGRLSLELEMTGDAATVLNPTNHTYFNLNGGGDVRDNLLWIGAKERAGRGEANLPDGSSVPVRGTPADFTQARSLRDAMADDSAGYFQKETPSFDEFYLLGGRKYRKAAVLASPERRRRMTVYTDMPCLVLFCSGDRAPETGKRGEKYSGYCAVCLETGFVPNAVNCPQYDSPVFQKGEKLTARTVYHFQPTDGMDEPVQRK